MCPVTDCARSPGQSQTGTDLHRHCPSPLYHPELWHHCRHVQRHCDRERSTWPAHGPEGSLLQAGYNRSTDQLTSHWNVVTALMSREVRTWCHTFCERSLLRSKKVFARISYLSQFFFFSIFQFKQLLDLCLILLLDKGQTNQCNQSKYKIQFLNHFYLLREKKKAMQTQLGLNEINLIFLYNWVHYH